MDVEYEINIEQVVIPFDPNELDQWKARDPELVPQYALDAKGPGVSHGYGYGEFFVQRYLKENGYSSTLEFDLISAKSKSRKNNQKIEALVGTERYTILHNFLNHLSKNGVNVENPDLCILSPQLLFAEAKKGKDFLRLPQIRFAYAIWRIIETPFKIFKLEPMSEVSTVKTTNKTFSVDFPEGIFDNFV